MRLTRGCRALLKMKRVDARLPSPAENEKGLIFLKLVYFELKYFFTLKYGLFKNIIKLFINVRKYQIFKTNIDRTLKTLRLFTCYMVFSPKTKEGGGGVLTHLRKQ